MPSYEQEIDARWEEEGRARDLEIAELVADHEAWQAYQATIDAHRATYTSEAIPGRASAFYSSDGRYWASDEDARRAQLDLDGAAGRQNARMRLRLALRALAATEAALTLPRIAAPVDEPDSLRRAS